MATDDSLGRNDDWIRYPGMSCWCGECFCPVYELAPGRLAAPLYSILNIVLIYCHAAFWPICHSSRIRKIF